MLSEANFLILDEPTNHLDMLSKEILEKALAQYEGTVLYVSHDRYFINKTATRLLDLENGRFTNYLGDYDYYLEKRALPGAPGGGFKKQSGVLPGAGTPWSAGPAADKPESAVKQDWKAQKEQQARERKRKNDLAKCESEIALLEEQNSLLEQQMSDPQVATSPAKLLQLGRDQEENAARLAQLYELWEQLADE